MKHTQRFIVILGDTSLFDTVKPIIAGFHGCTVLRSVSKAYLTNVYHFNKNGIFFTTKYDINWAQFNPITIQLKKGTSNIPLEILGTNNVIEDFPKILDMYDVDVGDHSSQDSCKLNTQSTDNCLLCKIKDHRNEKPEHIVYESPNFYVVPGTGAFFEGYLMIVPKEHIMSFAGLSSDEFSEFLIVLNDIRYVLKNIYSKEIFGFECGSGITGAGKHETSIVHAHFHLAPTDMPVLQEVQKSGLHPAQIHRRDLHNYMEHPYMLYVDQDDTWFIASDPHAYYPRQHPRQVLANWMGLYQFYNWRLYPYRERMDTIAQEFRAYCKSNFEALPKWTQNCVRFED